MELNRSAKQALSTLQGQISEPSDYILVTKENAIFKNEIFVKANTWENNTDTFELSDILLNVNLYNNNELSLLKNENNVLKKKIEELNLKLLQLENDKESEKDEEEEEEEEEDETPKKKVSGKPAGQEKIKKDIIDFFNNNRANEGDLSLENFNEFSITLNKENDDDRLETLKKIFNKLGGKASKDVYKSFIELVLLQQLYIKNFGDKNGKNTMNEDLNKIIKTTKKPSLYLKKANNFYFICKHLKEGKWKECNIAPTYWESVTKKTWNEILENLNLSEEGKVF
jgi:hypothetical protein